jgi:hypothetical protein
VVGYQYLGFRRLNYFGIKKAEGVVAIAGTSMSAVEIPCFRITTSPGSANLLLYIQQICREGPGCLATLASPH